MQGHEAWLRLGLVASHNFQPSLFRTRETCVIEANTLKPSQRWCAICFRALQTQAGDSNKTLRSPRPLPNHLYPSWNNHLIKNMYASILLAITALVSFSSAASPKEPIDPRGCTIILPTSYPKNRPGLSQQIIPARLPFQCQPSVQRQPVGRHTSSRRIRMRLTSPSEE